MQELLSLPRIPRGGLIWQVTMFSLAASAVVVFAAAVTVLASPSSTVGMRVRDGRILEADGHDLVIRGINHSYLWHADRRQVFADIKATGANTVRVALAGGEVWPATPKGQVKAIVAQCRLHRLICVLDIHDTMGWGQEPGAATLGQAVDSWLRLRSVLFGAERYVILNIGNEPAGYHVTTTWSADTVSAVRRLRDAGFKHLLMVDAPDWGADETHTMSDNAAALLAADPAHNIAFSIHMYGPYNTWQKVEDYLTSYTRRRLAVVVGEFAATHPYGDPDEDAIMSICSTTRTGYLGWSWSGNDTQNHTLDMVNDFDPRHLTPWGERFINGPDGIRATSTEAATFSDPSGTDPR
ncbi:cellulase family glycosylhydrolase [Dactylosporangium sp. CS-047395]|uniref:cellulase family glycosylhydrolase n=1 Tax=Dactylosporangium sp. CS-047395 TaxID=3239936 RepID=UPI003D926830